MISFTSTPQAGGRVLDHDIENMPLTYYAPDYPTAWITAIAWAFTDDPEDIQVRLYSPFRKGSYRKMLSDFVKAWDQATLVTGHYCRKHDEPIINGALIEQGMPPLSAKLVSDTKQDLVRFSNIPKNQEFLEAIMGTEQRKEQMTQYDWRQANLFTPEGLARTETRVVTDVRGHIQMQAELLERGLLRPPRVWRP